MTCEPHAWRAVLLLKNRRGLNVLWVVGLKRGERKYMNGVGGSNLKRRRRAGREWVSR